MRWRAPAGPPALGSVAPRARENGSADARSAPRGDGEHAGVAISIRGLTHRYRTSEGTLAVLDDVDLDVAAGGYTAVTGPSGAGKSTLLSVLGGLEPLQVGTVAVGDTDLAGLRGDDLAAYRRSTVGFVFQHFGLLEAMTAAENVELAGTLAGLRAGNPTGTPEGAPAISVMERRGRLRAAPGSPLVVVPHTRARGARPPQS